MATSSEENPAAKQPVPAADVPGRETKTSTKMLESAAAPLQSLKPIKNFKQHVCTWAHYSQDPRRKIQTHHHVARLNEDVLQCTVFDSAESDARLIGLEYVISDRLFGTLPAEEKKLWHSHFYEIRTGLWVNPGLPEVMAKGELQRLAKSYGKFWLTWQFDRGDMLPFGPPALMMSPQEEQPGQIPAELILQRDKQCNVSTAEKREARKSIQPPPGGLDPLADHWKVNGKGWATELKEVPIATPRSEGPLF